MLDDRFSHCCPGIARSGHASGLTWLRHCVAPHHSCAAMTITQDRQGVDDSSYLALKLLSYAAMFAVSFSHATSRVFVAHTVLDILDVFLAGTSHRSTLVSCTNRARPFGSLLP